MPRLPWTPRTEEPLSLLCAPARPAGPAGRQGHCEGRLGAGLRLLPGPRLPGRCLCISPETLMGCLVLPLCRPQAPGSALATTGICRAGILAANLIDKISSDFDCVVFQGSVKCLSFEGHTAGAWGHRSSGSSPHTAPSRQPSRRPGSDCGDPSRVPRTAAHSRGPASTWVSQGPLC